MGPNYRAVADLSSRLLKEPSQIGETEEFWDFLLQPRVGRPAELRWTVRGKARLLEPAEQVQSWTVRVRPSIRRCRFAGTERHPSWGGKRQLGCP